MKKVILSILGLGLVGLSHAGESTVEAKTTATMQATCSIEVSPLGFGVVATPLMSQSVSSEMRVKCSNSAAYTIDLAYGGIYGQGSSDSGYSLDYAVSDINSNRYYIYNNSGVNQGYIVCGYAGGYGGLVAFDSQLSANLYGYNYTGGIYQQDNKGACTSNNTKAGTYPTGWTGAFNISGKQAIGSSSGYTYGIMSGSFKGDSLAYSIAVPGESNKVWNAGNNSYKSSGNGDFQVIPVVAKIIPDKSGSKYPAPDIYLDTITAVISY